MFSEDKSKAPKDASTCWCIALFSSLNFQISFFYFYLINRQCLYLKTFFSFVLFSMNSHFEFLIFSNSLVIILYFTFPRYFSIKFVSTKFIKTQRTHSFFVILLYIFSLLPYENELLARHLFSLHV